MGDEREERSGPGQEGFLENILRDATTTGAEGESRPPDQPQAAAAMPRSTAEPDEDEDEDSGR
jgi:hypothetical protein